MKKIIIGILLIIFWISGYLGVGKILEIQEKMKEKQMLKKIGEDLNNGVLFGKKLDELFKEQEEIDKIKKIKDEKKRLSATIVSNSIECHEKSNSNLWQNKLLGFKMCIPRDYMGYSAYGGRFVGKVYDETEAIGIEDNLDRGDGYFSPIWINSYKKPYKIKINKSKQYLFETKKYIVIFEYNKKNKEHIEAIKSLKKYNKNKKIILTNDFLDKLNENYKNTLLENNLN